MGKTLGIIPLIVICFFSCNTNDTINLNDPKNTTFNFSHNWDGTAVTNSDFNTIQFVNNHGTMLSIERLRYVISDITFTTPLNEVIELDVYNLIDVTNNNNLRFSPSEPIPPGNYTNVSFTFGFDNEDNAENYLDLNSASFNVPDMLGGGYHYMQFDGKYLDANAMEAGFNYHAIRAVDNPGMNPTFPKDTFFTVHLGGVTITNNATFNIEMNIAEWFKTPNTWDLNQLNTVLMPNSTAQILIFENGQNVFSLGSITQ
jgi:hypothetical protein